MFESNQVTGHDVTHTHTQTDTAFYSLELNVNHKLKLLKSILGLSFDFLLQRKMLVVPCIHGDQFYVFNYVGNRNFGIFSQSSY